MSSSRPDIDPLFVVLSAISFGSRLSTVRIVAALSPICPDALTLTVVLGIIIMAVVVLDTVIVAVEVVPGLYKVFFKESQWPE